MKLQFRVDLWCKEWGVSGTVNSSVQGGKEERKKGRRSKREREWKRMKDEEDREREKTCPWIQLASHTPWPFLEIRTELTDIVRGEIRVEEGKGERECRDDKKTHHWTAGGKKKWRRRRRCFKVLPSWKSLNFVKNSAFAFFFFSSSTSFFPVRFMFSGKEPRSACSSCCCCCILPSLSPCFWVIGLEKFVIYSCLSLPLHRLKKSQEHEFASILPLLSIVISILVPIFRHFIATRVLPSKIITFPPLNAGRRQNI